MVTETSKEKTHPGDGNVIISVDAMGSDRGPSSVIAGMAKCRDANPNIGFIVHGDSAQLKALLNRRDDLASVCEIRHADDVVTMDARPGHVMRNGRNTSMWSAVDAVRNKEATAVVSCGNTGALMAVSMTRLRRLPGVDRPAIACLWPSHNPGGFNVMLDVGADIRANADDLMQYALMGASYARTGLGLERPRIGLLNVGAEEHKGRAELRAAHDLIDQAAPDAGFAFVGFVEGGDIPSARVDVIVTDGFTGNIALKTGEGTAMLIRKFLRTALGRSPLSRLGALLAAKSLRGLHKAIDPRHMNGGVFLGLNGTVVKSHGAADATGVAAAIRLAFRLAQPEFTERLAAQVASCGRARHDAGNDHNADGESE